MPRTIVDVESLPETMGPYSQCVVGQGATMVFIAGQVPEDPDGNPVGKGDVEAQTRQVLANIAAAVEAAGGTLEDICKITIFVVGLEPAAYETIARLRKAFFKDGYPASTMVEVKRLAKPEWLIEIEAYALI